MKKKKPNINLDWRLKATWATDLGGKKITRETFRRYVNVKRLAEIEDRVGKSKEYYKVDDWVYFIVEGISYVFYGE